MINRSLFTISLLIGTAVPVSAQYYQPQYNPPSFYSPGGNAAPVVVPPTVIMPGDSNSSKKSCRENVIDLFIVSWRTTSGDCTS